MQVTTVQKWQKVLDNSIKTARFVWRHAIVLGMLGMMIKVVSLQTANWRNILISLAIAALVDFFKMKIKIRFSNQHNNVITEQMLERRRRYIAWSTNPGLVGSPAYNVLNNSTKTYH